MAEQTFEKVAIVDDEGKVLESGTLTLYSDRLELDGKRRKITIPNIRGVTAQLPKISVTHGEGENLSVIQMMKMTAGLPKKVREVNRQLFEALRGMYGETQLTGADQQRVTAMDEGVRQAALRAARRSIWIGAALIIVGIVVTVVTYSNASGGGSYLIAYGPALVGLGMLGDGLIKARKNRARPSTTPTAPPG
ncbi:MAG: hypothetical protein WD770_03065 [Actinomycetota bacterium]